MSDNANTLMPAVIHADELLSVVDSISNYEEISWHGLRVVIRRLLPFGETSLFINSVMKSCFIEENGIFVAEAIDFAIRANTVLRHTNIELPEDLDAQYEILYNTDLFDCVLREINSTQHAAILEAIRIYTDLCGRK